jgi:hypothetical protein
MAEKRPGLATAVDRLVDEQPDAPAVEQLSLLPGAGPKDVQHGRPAGAVKRSTAEMVAFILATKQHPLLFLADVYSQPLAELAREAQCTLKEAKLMQVDAAKNLAPYISSKMPIAVEVDARGEVSLVISTVPLGATGAVRDNAVIIDVEDEENQ